MTIKNFLDKLTIKVKNRSTLLLRSMPINKKYKPIGVQKLLPNNDDSIEYLELSPPYTSTLALEPKFVADCSFFAKPEIAAQIPGDYVVTLKNGRVYSYDSANTAIISSKNYLIEELCFQWSSEVDDLVSARDNRVFSLKGFSTPKKIKGTVFSLLGGGGAKSYYYHWMIDSIARLGLLKKCGRFEEVDYFLVPNYSLKYHKETLDHFGITADKIIIEDKVPHLQADRLIVTSYTQVKFHHPKWACDFLHESFTVPIANKKRDRLIYIPRGDAAVNRKVINEPELINRLKKFGFESKNLSDMKIEDEAEYFNSAKLVLGVQGSGFANLVFCEPGTKVIQFFPDKYVRHIDYDICNKMQLDYHYLLCQSVGDARDTIEGQKIDVVADIPAIESLVESLLNQPKVVL